MFNLIIKIVYYLFWRLETCRTAISSDAFNRSCILRVYFMNIIKFYEAKQNIFKRTI